MSITGFEQSPNSFCVIVIKSELILFLGKRIERDVY